MSHRRAACGSRKQMLANGLRTLAAWCGVVAFAAATGIGLRSTSAQDPWEFTPYKIHIWLAFEDAPELPAGLREDIRRHVMSQSEAAFGSTWDVHVDEAPKQFSSELLYRLDQFPIDDLVAYAKLGKSAQPPKAKPNTAGAAGGSSSGEAAAKPTTTPAAPAAPAPAAPAPAAPAPTDAAPMPIPMPPAPMPPAAGACESPQEDGGSSAAGNGAAVSTAEAGAPSNAGAGAASDPAASSPAGAAASSGSSPTAAGGAASAPPTDAAVEGEEKPKHDPLVDQLRAVFNGDKLLVASVRATVDGWRVTTREMDVRARRWSELSTTEVYDRELLPYSIATSLHEVFYPIARIDFQKEKTIMLRLRAAGLSMRPEDPILVGENTFLRPWVRNNDRYGEPRPPLGVQTIPFSFLMVQKRETARLECELHTGVRFPVTGRNTARTQRFAIAVRPAKATTLVRLRTNEKPAQPLSGYDIFAKDPRNENIQLIGRTDWRGTMEVPPVDDFPLRVIYVKNGGSLLARLPTIPGLEPEMLVDLTPDDRRLQAEGYISGVQAVLTDLVAQRELYAKRIRAKLTDAKIAEAEQLLEEFKALQTRDDVQKLLDIQQPRITSPHKKVQAKIDKLFEDTRKLLFKHVDPALANQLENDVKQTKEGKGPYAAASGAMNAALGPASPPPAPPAPAPAAPAAAPNGSPPPMGSPPAPMGSPPAPMGSPPPPM
ncbi:MAG: hypothetical protein U0939_14765 [Pirellulales bacterium]